MGNHWTIIFYYIIIRLKLNIFLKHYIYHKKLPNLVAKILATKFGFVPDCICDTTLVGKISYINYESNIPTARITSLPLILEKLFVLQSQPSSTQDFGLATERDIKLMTRIICKLYNFNFSKPSPVTQTGSFQNHSNELIKKTFWHCQIKVNKFLTVRFISLQLEQKYLTF